MRRTAIRFRWVCLVGVVIGIGFLLGAAIAYAQSNWSEYDQYTVMGRTYGDKCAVTVFADGSGATARTNQDCEITRATGKLGVEAILWNGSYHVMKETGWLNNTYATDTWTGVTSPKCTNHGTYFSQADTHAKKDDGTWYVHYTYGTDPLQNPLP